MSFSINWKKVYDLFGIQEVGQPDANLWAQYWEWVKANVLLVLSFSVGFLMGWKVG